MKYTRNIANDFWYKLDEHTAFRRTSEVDHAIGKLFSFDFDLYKCYEHHWENKTFPDGFIEEISKIDGFRDSVVLLAKLQSKTMDEFLNNDPDIELRTFEDFAQGVLFDARRAMGYKIHKMNGGPFPGWNRKIFPPKGYHYWHAFIRSYVLLEGESDRWLMIDRYVGLAWAIQSLLKPYNDIGFNPNNPELSQKCLEQLRKIWLSRSFGELDVAFETYKSRPFASLPKVFDCTDMVK
jgi:hypothetical protein